MSEEEDLSLLHYQSCCSIQAYCFYVSDWNLLGFSEQ